MDSVAEIKKKIDPVCRHYGVDKVFLFGSYARGEATEQSDIDLRVDLGDMLRGLDVAGFYADMEDALGRRVDIMTTRQLPKKFLQSIRSEEVQVYGHSGYGSPTYLRSRCVPSWSRKYQALKHFS